MGFGFKINNPLSWLRTQANDTSRSTSATSATSAPQNTNKASLPKMALGTNPANQGNQLRRMYAEMRGNKVHPSSNDSARQAIREQAIQVARQMKQAGHTSAFLAHHDQLLTHFNLHGRPAQWQSASRDAVRTLAHEWRMDPRVASEVINILRAEQSSGRTSMPSTYPDARSSESTRQSQLSTASAVSRSSAELSTDHINQLRDLYQIMLTLHGGNTKKAIVAARAAFQKQFPDFTKVEVRRKLIEISTEAERPAPSTVSGAKRSDKLTDKEIESLRNIYNDMRALHGDDIDTVRREAQIAFQDEFPDARLLHVKRFLKELSKQPNPSTPSFVHASSSARGEKDELSPAETESLGTLYKRMLKHYNGDVDTAKLKTRLLFQEENPDVRLKTIKETLRKLSSELPGHQSNPSRPGPVRENRSPVQLSTDELESLRDIYTQVLTIGSHDTTSARRQAAHSFVEMFPQFQSNEHEIAKLLGGNEQPAPPRASIGPRQGEVRLIDPAKVRCGVASPNPVDPGQRFYREYQTTNQTTCAQHSLNALVGWNAFDMDYVEQVKYELIANAVGMSVEDVIKMEEGASKVSGQDPEVLAECLRRKAQAGEIDPKWKNAKTEFAVEVNGELWARLAQEKPDGMIIGRTDAEYSHYVAQRTDSSGQVRILDSLEQNEIEMATQEYIEGNLLASMAKTEDGTKRIHLITY